MRVPGKEFQRLVEAALDELPERFQAHLDDVVIDIVPMPSRQVLRLAEVDDPTELLGFYDGVPLTERSVEGPAGVCRILLFQRNIEDICESYEEIVEQVRTTVLHELGHHFGLDEDDLDELGYG